MIQTIPLLMSLAGSAYGMYKSGKENKQREALLRNQSNQLDTWYNSNYYSRYLDSPEGKSILSELYRQSLAGADRSVRRQKVTGGNNETRLADQGQILDNIGQTINGLAGQSQAYKTNLQNMYWGRKAGIDANMDQLSAMKNQGWMNFMGNIVNAGAGLAAMGSSGGKTTAATSGFFSNAKNLGNGGTARMNLLESYNNSLGGIMDWASGQRKPFN